MAPTRRSIAVAIALAVWLSAPAGPVRAATSPPVGSWVWPIDGSVVRGFEPPSTPYSPGHRGIDIAAPFGTPVVAPADGLVSFAGPVGGSLFVSIDHPDGYRSTSAYLSQVLVRKGQSVRAGQVVAMSGRGHPGCAGTVSTSTRSRCSNRRASWTSCDSCRWGRVRPEDLPRPPIQ